LEYAVNELFTGDGRQLDDTDWQLKIYDALDLFSPGAPIDEGQLLAGRGKQIDQLVEVVFQRGQHAILYGERGVGKSSLANVFATKIMAGARTLTMIHINCDPSDDFTKIWRKVFRRLSTEDAELVERYPDEITPDDIVIEFGKFALNTIPIVILDEFDKLADFDARLLTANAIKNLSDRSSRATVIIVGVADSVDKLVEDHASISRCLRQIPMQRMFPSELREIVEARLQRVGMAIQPDALAHIVALSRGLPHYTHLFGQRSAKAALERRSLIVELDDIDAGMGECIEQIDQVIRKQYHQATISPRSGNLYKEVLLAAALAPVDDLGYFAPADLRIPLSALLGRDAPVSLFGQHLKSLCEEDHGHILEQVGSARKFRYRFAEPMMQPFILMNGRRNDLITREQVDQLALSHYEPRLSSDF
jgi:DNA polymerase III delta prime subunit